MAIDKTHIELPAASQFRTVFRIAIPFALAAGLVLLSLALHTIWSTAPTDYQQGEFVRIMYVHVPSAWLGMGLYLAMAISSLCYLIWKHPLADMAAREMAPVGMIMTGLCLLTGMIWGKPMWGTWWVWDARLTTVLLMFILYVGYLALSGQENNNRAQQSNALAILSLIGALNIPIIRYSVEWWHTLHQPASVFRKEGSSIHETMLQPLMLSAMGMAFLCAAFVAAGILLGWQERKLQRKRSRAVAERS